jgi:hypothetical protein
VLNIGIAGTHRSAISSNTVLLVRELEGDGILTDRVDRKRAASRWRRRAQPSTSSPDSPSRAAQRGGRHLLGMLRQPQSLDG